LAVFSSSYNNNEILHAPEDTTENRILLSINNEIEEVKDVESKD
jgi:hypothetical protein